MKGNTYSYCLLSAVIHESCCFQWEGMGTNIDVCVSLALRNVTYRFCFCSWQFFDCLLKDLMKKVTTNLVQVHVKYYMYICMCNNKII